MNINTQTSSFPFKSIIVILLLVVTIPAFSNNKVIPFNSADVKELQGHYSTAYGYFYVHPLKKHMITNAGGKRIYLRKKEDGLIYPIYKLFGFIPLSKGDMAFSMKQKTGKQLVVVHTKNKKGEKVEYDIGEKFVPVAISTLWKQRLGEYKLLKDNKEIQSLVLKLAIKNNVLVGTRSDDNTTYPLLPHSDKSAVVPGSEGHKVEVFVKNNQLFLNRHKQIYKLVRK